MQLKEEVQQEYDALYRKKPNKWDNPDRSDFMIKVLEDFIPNPIDVVDVGCGNGVALENYRRSKPQANLYGIDPSPEGLKLAQKRVPDGHFTTDEEFKEIKQFDLVFCLGVAEHVHNLSEFLKDLKAKIKDGGICYVEVPNNLIYSAGPETYRRLTIGTKQVEWHFPIEKWESLLIESGFEIIKRYKGLNVTWEFIWVLK